MDVYTLHRGKGPLLVSLPHDGIALPEDLANRMTPEARGVPDTDWFVGRLYEFARRLGASLLVPVYSRYVIDLNRPPDDLSLYPGQNTTGLCPVQRFTGEPVYLPGEAPAADEIAARVERYWRPYHEALATELARLRAQHGRAVLWEGHSIRSTVPFLFDGRLPDFNLGTVGGTSCAPATQARVEAVLSRQQAFSWVANGRFKGGYITRRHGRPDDGVDALQLELAQSTYMDEATGRYQPDRAARVQALLEPLLDAAVR